MMDPNTLMVALQRAAEDSDDDFCTTAEVGQHLTPPLADPELELELRYLSYSLFIKEKVWKHDDGSQEPLWRVDCWPSANPLPRRGGAT